MDSNSCSSTTVNGIVFHVASLQCLPVLFANVLQALFFFAGTVAAILIIISGIRIITAGGDAKLLETARKTLTYAILGLFLILFSYLILSIIAQVTGVKCILDFGPFKNIAPNTCAQ